MLYMHRYQLDLVWDCYTLILARFRVLSYFTKLAAELWPSFDVGWDFYVYLAFSQHKSAAAGQ